MLGSTIRVQLGGLDQLKSNFSAAALALVSSGWVWFVVDELGNLGILPTFGAGTLLAESRMQKSPFVPTTVVGESETVKEESVPARGQKDPLWTGARRPLSRPASSSSSSRLLDTPRTRTSPLSGASAPHPPFTPSTSSRSILTFPKDDLALSSSPPGMFDDSKAQQQQQQQQPPPPLPVLPSGHSDFRVAGTGKTLHPLFCVSVFEHAWMSAGYGVWGKEEYMRRFWAVVDWEKANSRYLYHTKRSPEIA
jgi:superoxide dismutase, Fe-Mn family